MSFRAVNGGALAAPQKITGVVHGSSTAIFHIQDDASPANELVKVLNIGTSQANYAAAYLLFGANGAWNFGIDVGSSGTKYADFFLGQYNYPTAGLTRDTFYIQQNGVNPPGIGMGGGASQYTDMAANIVTIQPWSDSPSTQGGLTIRTGTAQATTTPAFQILYQNGAGPLITVWPTGQLEGRNSSNTILYKTDTTGTFYTSGRLAVGSGTDQTQTGAIVLVKTASGTDATLQITTGAGNGNFSIQAQDASANVFLGTINNSSLTIRQNSTQVIKLTTGKSVALGVTNIATTSTDGFPYIPAAAGTPTGVATAITGFVPLYYDTTAHKIWVYDGGWKGVVVA